MTTVHDEREVLPREPRTIEKVSIVVSKGSLEGIYPALIMANGARMEGIEADLFFTFFGLDAIQGPLRAHQGRDRRQPPHAHAHLDRRDPVLLGARSTNDET